MGVRLWLEIPVIVFLGVSITILLTLAIGFGLHSIFDREFLNVYVVFLSWLFSGFVLVFAFYRGYIRKEITHFPIAFCTVGIILILMGSVIKLPYTTKQTLREDKYNDYTDSFRSPDGLEKPLDENGSLRKITFPPSSTIRYVTYETLVYESYVNRSIFQIDIATTGTLSFKIVAFQLSYGGAANPKIRSTYFEGYVYNNWWENELADKGDSYFWTPPTRFTDFNGLVFENHEDHEIFVSFRVKMLHLKATEQIEVTDYRAPIHPYFAYGGISLVIAAIPIGAYSLTERKRKQKN